MARSINLKTWHRYEFGRATVFVKNPACNTILDGIVRVTFQAQVHPVAGPVMETEVQAFYPWDAANRALNLYNELREGGK